MTAILPIRLVIEDPHTVGNTLHHPTIQVFFDIQAEWKWIRMAQRNLDFFLRRRQQSNQRD